MRNRFDLKAKINLKKFKQIVKEEKENAVLNTPIYPKSAKLNQFIQILVEIIQFSLEKLCILQKISIWTWNHS